ncbi:N-acetylmuramoyl-L-alanine amidase family protein, partial [Paenibacillus larvae]
MEIRKMLVDPSKYGIKCPNKVAPKYITYHNTANDASAENEIRYMIRNNNEVSFHVAVDDKEAVQGIPFDR